MKNWLNILFYKYRKSSINPPGRLILISDKFEGVGLIETATYLRGGLVSVLHKDLECKVEKLKYKKLEVM